MLITLPACKRGNSVLELCEVGICSGYIVIGSDCIFSYIFRLRYNLLGFATSFGLGTSLKLSGPYDANFYMCSLCDLFCVKLTICLRLVIIKWSRTH